MALGWLLAAAATTTVGMAAIETLGPGLTGDTQEDGPLSAADVQRRLAAESSPSPSPITSFAVPEPTGDASPAVSRTLVPSRPPSASPAASPSTDRGSTARALALWGGTVHASCRDGLATLDAWSPAPGFRVVDAKRGPAASVSIRFKRDDEAEGRTVITCVGDEPTATALPHDD